MIGAVIADHIDVRSLKEVHSEDRDPALLIRRDDLRENLRERLSDYRDEIFGKPAQGANISRQDLLALVRAFEFEREVSIRRDSRGDAKGLRRKNTGSGAVEGQKFNFYFLDKPGSDKLCAILSSRYPLRFVLDPKAYGFSGDRIVTFDQKEVSWAEEKLNPEALAEYRALLARDKTPLNNVLETVGRVVNSSVKYNWDSFLVSEPGANGQEIKRRFEDFCGNQPNGPTLGICTDAGAMIRDILFHLNIENIGVLVVSAQDGNTSHDTKLSQIPLKFKN